MNILERAIERLGELEPGLMSLDSLLVLGAATMNKTGFQVGDFDLFVWGHGLDNFSVGAIVRTRHDGNPFPPLKQSQKKWIISCKGKIKVVYGGNEVILSEGEILSIAPKTSHEIYPVSGKSISLMVIIPADPGMQ